MPNKIKDTNTILSDLHPDLQNFYSGLSNVYTPRITSGRRKNAFTKQGNTSRHAGGEALDIEPNKNVYEYLWNTPQGISLLVNNGLGILDETSPEMLDKTGGTGAHYHIGKDSSLVEKAKQRFFELNGSEYVAQNNENMIHNPIQFAPQNSFIDYQFDTVSSQDNNENQNTKETTTDSQEQILQNKLLKKQKEYKLFQDLMKATDIKKIYEDGGEICPNGYEWDGKECVRKKLNLNKPFNKNQYSTTVEKDNTNIQPKFTKPEIKEKQVVSKAKNDNVLKLSNDLGISKEDAKLITQLQEDQLNNPQILKEHIPQSTGNKLWENLTNPLTDLGYAARGEDRPDYISKGNRNPLDYAVDVLNPFSWADYGYKSMSDYGDALGKVYEGDYRGAVQSATSGTFNLLGAIPAYGSVDDLSRIGKTIQEIPKTVNKTDDIVKPIVSYGTDVGKPFQNRVFDSNMQLGTFKGKGHLSEVGYNYGTLGIGEIEAIKNTKGVYPKVGKARGGNENVKYWTKGNEKNWYADNPKQNVIRVKENKFSTDKVVRAEDVEVFNHSTGKFEPIINPVDNVIKRFKSKINDVKWNKEIPKFERFDDKVRFSLKKGTERWATEIEDITKREIENITSPEYLKTRILNTGETEAQVLKDINKILKNVSKTSINSTNLPSGEGEYLRALSTGLSHNGDGFLPSLNFKPSINFSNKKDFYDETLGIIDHEIKHAFSPASTARYGKYKNYPKLDIKKLDSKPYERYLKSEMEQQVRFNKIKDYMEETYDIKRGTQLSDDDITKLINDIDTGKFNRRKYADVLELLNNLNKQNVGIKEFKDALNKAWGVIPPTILAGLSAKNR